MKPKLNNQQTLFMILFKIIIQLYTWITLPLYFIIQQPWNHRRRNENNRLRIHRHESDKSDMTDIYIRNDSGVYDHPIFEQSTLTKMFQETIRINRHDQPCLGYRKILEEIPDEKSGGGKVRKYRLSSSYKWLTYMDVDKITNNLAQGLMANGVQKSDRILIFAETRVEWMICFQSILRIGSPIVTVYANMGIEGLKHGIEETNVHTIITSLNCVPMLMKTLNQSQQNSVKQVIYMDGDVGKKIIENNQQQSYPDANIDDPLVIMYTSGTTGTPKAATITQRQFCASIRALYTIVRNVAHSGPLHTYVSYLPMAHIMELTLEIFFTLFGVRLGYATPFTLIDSATGLAKGQKSDLQSLKPTIMTSVPLVLERILKQIDEKLRNTSTISQMAIEYLIDYKAHWTSRGYQSPLITYLISSKIREKFGGNLRVMICGGAALDPIVESRIRAALDVILMPGYGATETTGAAFCMDFHGLDYGFVGAPMGDVYFRLRDWNEGGYSVRDKPNPRGEILIGGDLIVIEYFRNSPLTSETFQTDQNGIRWFQTGDIGELYPNGYLKIIDRRKDLIKLQNGEYISLGKVEAALKRSQYVENICVYGHIMSDDLVALITPERNSLKQLAKDLNKSDDMNIQDLCNDKDIERTVYEDITKMAIQSLLGRKEIPRRIRLVPDVWSNETGVLTAALKMKRRVVEKMYRQQLADLYSNHDNNNIDANNNVAK
ncbi:long chain fatty acid coa ligase-like protein [Dermatophagoides farinae]|uniref:long-chain-fatty-acid--CoA ligase n=1 Tax=Dermatophagoides farinae TaxID=6954 RepID=A0A9D4NTL4_DERFA|nr:long chain fatty acid coa ligase-like protein [Dermatophagoides farinae]